MANKKEKDPDFIKLLEELKDNKQSDVIKLPNHLMVSLDEAGNSIILFSSNGINVCIKDKVLNINGKAAQLVYQDKSIKDALLDYAKTGDKRKIVDVFIKLLVYRDYNDAINFLDKKGKTFDDQEMINEINESYNALRKELKNEAAKQGQENKEQLTR